MRHRYADLIHAWAEGAEIELYDANDDRWKEIQNPSFCLHMDYRIKPTPNPDVVWYANPRIDGDMCAYMSKIQEAGSNLKLTFDGDTGELKYAEVIK
jgi:hypothetical protein